MNTRPVVVGIARDQPEVLRYALDEARRRGTYVRVAHVVSHDELVHLNGAPPPLLDRVRQAVAAEVDPPKVDVFDWWGDPAEVLATESREACLVVVGGDELPWIARMTGGEVARKVSLTARCPVVVVPADRPHPERVGGVVVAVDASRPIEEPLRYAFQAAQQRSETLQVVTAPSRSSDREGRDADRRRLDDVVDRYRLDFPDVLVLPVLDAEHSVAACLLASHRASLLVLGRPLDDHAPWSPLGVAGRVLRRARSPVVIVPLDHAFAVNGV
jgi:nucleotide-binding universal stress UspA family protein